MTAILEIWLLRTLFVVIMRSIVDSIGSCNDGVVPSLDEEMSEDAAQGRKYP